MWHGFGDGEKGPPTLGVANRSGQSLKHGQPWADTALQAVFEAREWPRMASPALRRLARVATPATGRDSPGHPHQYRKGNPCPTPWPCAADYASAHPLAFQWRGGGGRGQFATYVSGGRGTGGLSPDAC
uniref:Uncharacterized protein n=1 Tax=Eutreptiella gymnastica TaxID=73025 RepID=A0A7S1NLC6_9EUGL|mmetsp:Transcript_54089/g.96240  ORF Transcript_54089/g.96240 Transcript_54089/m.96240 type:complete len:129 (+) Transcript_54089:576-962(+)